MSVADLGRLSRFETPQSIRHIGNWFAARPVPDLVHLCSEAVHYTQEHHVLSLLCVFDVILKFSEDVSLEVARHMVHWLRQLPTPEDPRLAGKCDELVVYWCSVGLVPVECSLVTFANNFGSRVHACVICLRRFAHAASRDAHMDVHVRAALDVYIQFRKHEEVFALGVFYSLREKRRKVTEILQPEPLRVASPIQDASRVCPLCGDAIERTYCDIHDAWVLKDCTRDISANAVHDECYTNVFLAHTV